MYNHHQISRAPLLVLRMFQLLAIITALSTFALTSIYGFQNSGYYGAALYGFGGIFVAALLGFIVLVIGQILANLVEQAITYWPVSIILLCGVLYGTYHFNLLPSETTSWVDSVVKKSASKDQSQTQQTVEPISQRAIKIDNNINSIATGNTPPQQTEVNESSGCDVYKIQDVLTQLGFYSGTIDGVWGSQTSSAVLQYQNFQRLQATGLLDDRTCQNIIDQVATTY